MAMPLTNVLRLRKQVPNTTSGLGVCSGEAREYKASLTFPTFPCKHREKLFSDVP